MAGEGALEAYNGPEIYRHPGLEEFETSSDLNIIDMKMASKTYEYTYLARSSFHISAREMPLVYFDPDTESYRELRLNIPGIEALGGVLAPNATPPSSTGQESGDGERQGDLEGHASEIVGPIFYGGLFNQLWGLQTINILLAMAIIALLGSYFWMGRKRNLTFEQAQQIIKSFKGRAGQLLQYLSIILPHSR